MTTVVRKIQFCAAHRLCGHEGKCAQLHGHNYVAHLHATADRLDELGMVMDFSTLRERLGGWIEANWDHAIICYKGDGELQQALATLRGQKLFLLDENPTAENLARYLLNVVGPQQLAGTGVRLIRVALWETDNCCAEAAL